MKGSSCVPFPSSVGTGSCGSSPGSVLASALVSSVCYIPAMGRGCSASAAKADGISVSSMHAVRHTDKMRFSMILFSSFLMSGVVAAENVCQYHSAVPEVPAGCHSDCIQNSLKQEARVSGQVKQHWPANHPLLEKFTF